MGTLKGLGKMLKYTGEFPGYFIYIKVQLHVLAIIMEYMLHKDHIQLILRRLMSYIYGAPILDVSRSHTTTQHSR